MNKLTNILLRLFKKHQDEHSIAKISFEIAIKEGNQYIKTESDWSINGIHYMKLLLAGIENGMLLGNALASIEEKNTIEGAAIINDFLDNEEEENDTILPSQAFRN